MKKLLAYVYISLMFCNVGDAEKISDFELDGISIGDSLLQYMTKEEILSDQKESNEAYKNLTEGNSKKTKSQKNVDKIAAMTMVANTLLNLNESYYKY